jgi:large subunit ribosomal protein L29
MAINKDLSNEEMLAAIEQAEAEMLSVHFDHAVTPIQDTSIFSKQRKDIARMHTELRARELAAATPEELAKRSKMRLRRRK